MEDNKLCSLQSGTMGKFPCQLCSTPRKQLDNPSNVAVLNDDFAGLLFISYYCYFTCIKTSGILYYCSSSL